MAGSQSCENIFVTPSSSTTRSRARPKTGDGFASGSRSVAMMSSRNGSTAEHAGRSAARFSGCRASSLRGMALVSKSGFNLRTAQTLTATKKTANAPSRKNDVGRPVSSAGILKINAPVAARVSTITASTGSSEAIITARPMASTSTSSTNGQTINESSASLKIGMSTSTSASGGKIWLPHNDAGDAAPALQQHGKNRVNDGENEIKRQRRVQQFVVQGFGRPRGEQPKDREAGDGLGGGNFIIEQDEGGDDQVNQENETEHQPRSLRQRRKGQEPCGEDQGNGHQSKGGTRKPFVCQSAKF